MGFDVNGNLTSRYRNCFNFEQEDLFFTSKKQTVVKEVTWYLDVRTMKTTWIKNIKEALRKEFC